MNAPRDYKPAVLSADLPPLAPSHYNQTRTKTLKALVLVSGHGFLALNHAARGHRLAFIESGSLSRWVFKRGGDSAELFADLIRASDANGRRWRIVNVISAEIVSEG